MRLIELIEMVASLLAVVAIICVLLYVGTLIGEGLELLWMMTH